ncbi:MAG: hypothetical protein ACRDQD_01125 [Nocardioidaceae bacterium]
MTTLTIDRHRFDRAVEAWKPGERIVLPGQSGSYPDRTRDRYGTVVRVVPRIDIANPADLEGPYTITVYGTLVVWLDGDDDPPRAINQDVARHTGRPGDHDPYPEGNPAHVTR